MINLRHQTSTKMKIDKRLLGVFIPCTEQQANEVYELLERAGLMTDGFIFPKHWTGNCTGVKTYDHGTFQCIWITQNLPTLTIEELRQIVNESTK
jgi:hypothetical protein